MRLIFLFFLFSLPASLFGQSVNFKARTALYVELGGSGGITGNLDILHSVYYNFKSSIRVGGGISPVQLNGKTVLIPVIPVEILGFVGPGAKNVEFGLGYTHRFSSDTLETKSYYTARFGFRYQKPKGGFLFRGAITPILYQDNQGTRKGFVLSPGFGLSLGKSF